MAALLMAEEIPAPHASVSAKDGRAFTRHEHHVFRFVLMAPMMMGHRIKEGLVALSQSVPDHWELSHFRNSQGFDQPIMSYLPPKGEKLCRKTGQGLISLYAACSCGVLNEHREDQVVDWAAVMAETDGMPWLTELALTCNATLCQYMVLCAKASGSASLLARVKEDTGFPSLPPDSVLHRLDAEALEEACLPKGSERYYGMGVARGNGLDLFYRRAVCSKLAGHLTQSDIDFYADSRRMWRATLIATSVRKGVESATICAATLHANGRGVKGLEAYSLIHNPDPAERSLAGRIAYDEIVGQIESGEPVVLLAKLFRMVKEIRTELRALRKSPEPKTAKATPPAAKSETLGLPRLTQDAKYWIHPTSALPDPSDVTAAIGQCMYRALAALLDEDYVIIRNRISSFVRPGPGNNHEAATVSEADNGRDHADDVMRGRVWGGHTELAAASLAGLFGSPSEPCCRIWEVSIRVYADGVFHPGYTINHPNPSRPEIALNYTPGHYRPASPQNFR